MDTSLELGDVKAALDAARSSMEIIQALYNSNPANADYRYAVSVSREKVGDALLQEGNLDGAMKEYRESLKIRSELGESGRGDA